jgi:hypothetical protein
MKTLRRSPYLNVAQWIDERAPSSVDDANRASITEIRFPAEAWRLVIGCCILMGSPALSAVGSSSLGVLSALVEDFNSVAASVFEICVLNAALFSYSICGYVKKN